MQALTGRLVMAVLAILVLVLGWQLHMAREQKKAADFDVGLASSRVLSAKFGATGELRVARLTGEIVSEGNCTSSYLFDDKQQSVAPYRADYTVDLARIDRSQFRWDERDRVMFVELPGVVAEPATVDMGQARSRQSGVFISRGCGLAMQKQVAGRLQATATERSHRPDYLAAAADSARARVAQLVRSTLAAAGLANVTVRVRLATDPRPNDDRQWDRSRSIEEVLNDPKYRP